jgi:hypothetical protein
VLEDDRSQDVVELRDEGIELLAILERHAVTFALRASDRKPAGSFLAARREPGSVFVKRNTIHAP